MATWLRSSDGTLTLAAAGLLVVAATGGAPTTIVFLAFTLLIAISELFEVTLPNEVTYTLGLAPALGFVMLGSYEALEVVLAFGLGAGIAVGIRALAKRRLRIPEIATHIIALALAAGVYAQLSALDEDLYRFRALSTSISPAGLLAMFLTVLLVQSLLGSIRVAQQDRTPVWPAFRGQVTSTAALQLSAVSVGALLALSYPSLDVYAFLLFLAPLAATQYAFRQFASIRKTYLQTIRALSKVPEMAGYTEPGHSTRVAALSVAIANELGITEPALNEIEYAALLHDIGRISIPDPDDDHAIAPAELAQIGATIVRETGHLPRVAEMIQHQQDPYRRRGEDVDRAMPAGAKIIKVASAYDDMTRPGGIGLSSWDALEKLHLGMAYEYDPQVIQALTRALEKRGAI